MLVPKVMKVPVQDATNKEELAVNDKEKEKEREVVNKLRAIE